MAHKRAGPHVPRFGNWDANDHAPYTKVFDTARATKGGRLINPNDPSENPEAFEVISKPAAPVAHDNPPDPARRARADNRAGSREDREFKKYMESPVRQRQSPAVGRTYSSADNNNNKRHSGSENAGLHRSPLHPQAKAAERSAPALPKFGDWDATDPASGEGFTTIFNNARTERQSGAGPGRIPQVNSAAPGHRPDHYRKPQSNWFCCFS